MKYKIPICYYYIAKSGIDVKNDYLYIIEGYYYQPPWLGRSLCMPICRFCGTQDRICGTIVLRGTKHLSYDDGDCFNCCSSCDNNITTVIAQYKHIYSLVFRIIANQIDKDCIMIIINMFIHVR